ncbi:MAG: hypothetical protein E7498_06295 [Ruminococcus sp.]|nr:hypothetical protein [Ruminococcus sp.]
MMKCTTQTMMESLDTFMVSYDYPVYVNINNMSSFFSSGKNWTFGYMAVTDNGYLLVTEYGLLSQKGSYMIMIDNISKLSAKKQMFGMGCQIKLEALCEGKKLRLELYIPFKAGSDFDNQKEKAQGLLGVLSRCPVFKGVTLL